MSLPWFRMYHEFSGDPIVQALAFEDQRHFVMALCFKASGFLDRDMPSPEFRHRAICKALGLDPIAGADALRRLSEVGLVDESWQPAAWERRQFTSDDSSARVAKYRQRRSAHVTANVTVSGRYSNVPDTDTDTDTDTDKNLEGSQEGREPSRKRSDQPPPSKTKLATRIPEGWQPSLEMVAYAEKELPNVDTAKLAEAFTDYWQAAAGAKARKLDWNATWRTWVRRSCDRYPTRAQSRATAPQIRIDANGRQISG